MFIKLTGLGDTYAFRKEQVRYVRTTKVASAVETYLGVDFGEGGFMEFQVRNDFEKVLDTIKDGKTDSELDWADEDTLAQPAE